MRQLFRPILITSFVIASLSYKLSAQTSASSKPLNVAVINSLYFEDDNKGVTKLVNTRKKAEAEFKPKMDELGTMQMKLDDIKKR